jgi:hypothetical protein
MLVIRQQQIEAFEQVAMRRFEDEMIAHSKEFSPVLSRVLGDAQLRVVVRSAIARAMGYGFTWQGPVRLFIEMTFLCGSAFDTDPQYPGLHDVLRSGGHQMDRAMEIHEGRQNYLARVSGSEASNVRKALGELATFARAPLAITESDYVSDMISAMQRVFPEKAAYAGEAGLRSLISEATAEATRYQFSTTRHRALIVVLMFAFGHGCTDDPLYPWISRTLEDPRITGPDARARRLEKKARTWLEHVLATPHQGQTQ